MILDISFYASSVSFLVVSPFSVQSLKIYRKLCLVFVGVTERIRIILVSIASGHSANFVLM